MSFRFIPLLLLLFPVVLTAQGRQGVIYKCRDPGGNLSYQSQRCPPGTEVRDLRVYTDQGVDPWLAHKVESDRLALEARRFQRAGSYSDTVRNYGPRECANERARRDRLRRQIGSQRITWLQEVEFCRPVQQMCGSCSPGYPPIAP